MPPSRQFSDKALLGGDEVDDVIGSPYFDSPSINPILRIGDWVGVVVHARAKLNARGLRPPPRFRPRITLP